MTIAEQIRAIADVAAKTEGVNEELAHNARMVAGAALTFLGQRLVADTGDVLEGPEHAFDILQARSGYTLPDTLHELVEAAVEAALNESALIT